METVLVVDENPGGRELAREILASAGYTVLEAGTADEAVAAIPSGRPIQPVITDVVLTGVRGTTLAKEMSQRQPPVKILLISGYLDASESSDSSEFQDLPFLRKPFTSKQLKEMVRSLLGGAPRPEQHLPRSRSRGCRPR
jgi:DNA-binding NtrC family response regulator